MIGILNLYSANVSSVASALLKLGKDYILVSSECDLKSVTHLLIPGVGSFDDTINDFHNLNLGSSIRMRLEKSSIKIMGICIGLQILSHGSKEGKQPGLGLIDGFFLPFNDMNFIPNIGWRKVRQSAKLSSQPIDISNYYYFMHSYHLPNKYNKNFKNCTVSSFEEIDFLASVMTDNILGVQFHPERSSNAGLKMIVDFTAW